jgi:hypothetical protein
MITKFLKTHWIAILLAIIIGAITVAPPLVWRMSADYQGVDMLKTNTETLYMSMINEVIDGHWGLGNPYLWEGKDVSYLFPPVSAWLIGGFGKLFGLSAVNAALFMRFLLPAIIAFLIYWFAKELTGNKLIGLITAPFVLLAYTLMISGGLASLINPSNWNQEVAFVDYGRPITPQVSVLFFYLYIVLFLKIIDAKSSKWYSLAATLVLGLSFYTYFYTWTYIFTINAFAILVFAIKKDWVKVKNILYVSFGAAALGIPYILNNLSILVDPAYAGLSERFGFVHHRNPIISKTVVGALFIFLAAYKYLPEKVRDFFAIIFLTGIFTVNQHVITGRYFRFDNHHHWYYNRPMVILLLVCVGFLILKKLKASKLQAKIISAALILLFIYNGFVIQKVSYAAALPDVIDEQRLAPVIDWMQGVPKDSVVLAENPLRILVPSLTQNNVYFTNGALYTLTPHERIVQSYLTFAYLKNGVVEDARSLFEDERVEVSSYLFGYTYQVQPGICLVCFPDSVIDDLVERYENLNDDNFIDFLKKYRIDYIAWDKKSTPKWNVGKRFGLEQVASFGEVIIYDLKPKT